ncbi:MULTISPECIES: endopeptidase La [Kandleria]|jgi:ATP-dependent Lon protease|uniref:endopeptidase La n=1 Tax=Kandleria TaxID=1279388 RepID=UPI000563ACA1|nr:MULTISPECIES: endopeptidase La [Kandleria]MBP3276895.1 endopeptidase La [Kandleria sp.]MEE0988433.1 endopeptidase La [Kandleria vitulina]SDL54039.1 ATP-dependent Lon protease [Kandleria vitulina]SEI77222.1 ATP-dependent Lon protease [Kandleria vitulina]
MDTNIIELPVICTRGMLVFPGHDTAIDVGRSFSLKAIDDAVDMYDSHILFVSQIHPLEEEISIDTIYKVGTACSVVRKVKKDNHGTIKLTVAGEKRAKIHSFYEKDGCYYAKVEYLEDVFGDENEETALVRKITEQMQFINRTAGLFPRELFANISQGLSASELADAIGHYMNIDLNERQKILDEADVNKRLLLVLACMQKEKTINEIESTINDKVKKSIDENQKEFYLRERLRAIKEELGDTPNGEDEVDQIRKKIKENPYPQNIKDKLTEELQRYEMMPASSPEANVVRNYIDWVLKLPWWEQTDDNEDIVDVEKILDDDHFGLEKPKERIVEHLAVKQMTQSLNAPIICLVGPPGTGKTSLAKSIAHALGRKFIKASLGGVTDESEIRGHRRTYLGSMPGRIIQGMKKAGVVNPVFLLDEIDKMSSDYKGDPTSAMLEVLDPEQNSMFSDNFIEEPYDLSKVLFIATANDLGSIPGPLRDRLEVIELSSYTEQEKVQIARNHLIKKQLKNHGLTAEQFTISDETVLYVIQHYTREAGVRQLERLIASLCRKAVLKILKDKAANVDVKIEDLQEYLGKAPFDHTKKLKDNQIGVVTGLAWTQFGGDILPIEVNHFPGSGKFNVTGQLGDVMKESASIALDYMKANAAKYGLSKEDFENQDIHIHVPEGAVKKDGPSAGVTLTTALYSSFTKKAVKNDVAMTGEITLTGEVLPIGGLKEKSISAHRSGISTIIIPKDNEKDIDDIPESVKKELTIIVADHIDTVLKHAIV